MSGRYRRRGVPSARRAPRQVAWRGARLPHAFAARAPRSAPEPLEVEGTREPARAAPRPRCAERAGRPQGVAAAAAPGARPRRPARPARHRGHPGRARGLTVANLVAARGAAGARSRSSTSRSTSATTCPGSTSPARPGTSASSAPRRAASPPPLRTLVTALALTHTPHEVQFYCLDFGGGTARHAARAAPRRRRRRPPGHRRGTPYRRRGLDAARRPGAPLRRPWHRLDGGRSAAAPPRRPRRHGRRRRRTASATSSCSSTAGPRAAASTRISNRCIADIATRGLELRHPPGRHGHAVAGLPAAPQRPVRGEAGAAPRRPEPTRCRDGRAAETVPKATPGRGLTSEGAHLMTALPQLDPWEPASW